MIETSMNWRILLVFASVTTVGCIGFGGDAESDGGTAAQTTNQDSFNTLDTFDTFDSADSFDAPTGVEEGWDTSDTADATGESGTGETTGDGDGDTTDTMDTTDTTGDGDGDTGDFGNCGWLEADAYYACGGIGEDPLGDNPILCPDGLIEGDVCANTGLTGEGCCDLNGDNWYCGDDGMGNLTAVYEACG